MSFINHIRKYSNMKAVFAVLVLTIIIISCGKEDTLKIPDFGPFQAIVSFYDIGTGEKVNPAEVYLGNMRLASPSSFVPTFNSFHQLNKNDTGAFSFKQNPSAATISVISDLYMDIPYLISGIKYAGETPGTISASLVSTEKFNSNFRVGLYKKAVTSIHIKQVTDHPPSYFRIWLDSYSSADTTEANKIIRTLLLPEGIYQSPDKKIDTTIIFNLTGDQYNSLQYELFGFPDGWGEFYNKYLDKLDAKKYEADKRHEILITF